MTFHSSERKDPPKQQYYTQQSCPSEMQEKHFPRQAEAEEIHQHYISPIRNVSKGSYTWQ
jgi:hypothetical protein